MWDWFGFLSQERSFSDCNQFAKLIVARPMSCQTFFVDLFSRCSEWEFGSALHCRYHCLGCLSKRVPKYYFEMQFACCESLKAVVFRDRPIRRPMRAAS
jgi:hypothetical protein